MSFKIWEIENDSCWLVGGVGFKCVLMEGGLDDDWYNEIFGDGFNGICVRLLLCEVILK